MRPFSVEYDQVIPDIVELEIGILQVPLSR
jgi:hypothetical protein